MVLGKDLLVLLQALIRLTILAEAITTQAGSTLWVLAVATGAGTAATAGTTLLAGLDWVDLAVGELGLLDALVGLAVLAETVVLCAGLVKLS